VSSTLPSAPKQSPSPFVIGFDDNRSLGPQETGGRIALPVFKEIMLRVYRDKLVGPAPEFPAQIEQRISDYLKGDSVSPPDLSNPPAPVSAGFARGSEASQGRP